MSGPQWVITVRWSIFSWALTSWARRLASTLVAFQNVDGFNHIPETDAVSICTADLVVDNWSREDLVVCSVPMPNHLTFLLTITLSSQRSTIRCWTGEPALPQVLFRIYRSVSCLRPDNSDLRLMMVFDSLITTRWIWSQDQNGGKPFPNAFRPLNLSTSSKNETPFTHGAGFLGKTPSGKETSESWMRSGADYRRSGEESQSELKSIR